MRSPNSRSPSAGPDPHQPASAEHENPGDLHGSCGGPDIGLGIECTCPDLVYVSRIRLQTHVARGMWECYCCNLPITAKWLP